jgi:hypothetical protein
VMKGTLIGAPVLASYVLTTLRRLSVCSAAGRGKPILSSAQL